MPTISEYLSLITSNFRNKPKYTQMVSDDVSAAVRVQDVMKEMGPAYDVDTAVGSQLDDIGLWVGINRNIPIPIGGVYFSWDGDASVGWEFGTWQPENEPTEITSLPDDVYRLFIRAKIAANRWDGTLEGMYAVWDQVFTEILIYVQDNQDMSYNIGFFGGPVDSLTLALIQQGYLPLKPEGVRVNLIYAPVDNNKIFAWDVDSDVFAGWDDGSWTKEINVS